MATDCVLWSVPAHACQPGTVAPREIPGVGEIPLCRYASREIDRIGRERFEGRYEMDLPLIAAGLAERWDLEHGGDAA